MYIRGLSERSVTPLGQKVQQKLTVDEDKLQDLDSQLDALSNYIGLTKDGKVVFKVDRSKLSQRHRILLYAIGKYLAHEAGYASEPHVTIEELVNELGLGYTVTTARCSELRREGLLLSVERGAYRVLLRRAIEKVLAELSREQV
jgi:hypothetical protein